MDKDLEKQEEWKEEEPAGREMAENAPAGQAEEPAEELAKELAEELAVQEKKPSGGKNILAIVLGLAVFAGVLALCWNMAGNAHRAADIGVLYAKDNEMRFFDLENEPYTLAERISDGGSYHYYYSAWGAMFSEKGDRAAYAAEIDAAGRFTLYRKDATDPLAEPEKIDGDVLDYSVSRDGRQLAYLKAEGEQVSLWLSDGAPRLVAEDMLLDEQAYFLSGDGKYLLYTVHGADGMGLFALPTALSGETPPEAVELCGAVEMYALAEETGKVYYVAQGGTGGSYDIFGYALQDGTTERIAENVAYMEVMPNGRDLLYCRASDAPVLYRDLVVDDMQEADAALPENPTAEELAENPVLQEKQERDRIRQAMENGEGFDAILLDCYILTGGRTVKAAEQVISAAAVANDRPFVTGYQAAQPEPIPISELGGDLEAVEFAYYGALAYGEKKAFLADASGNCVELPLPQGGTAETVQLSKDGSRVAYFERDMETGIASLMLAEVQEPEGAALVQTNVESAGFLGGGNTLGYYCNYADGLGTVATSEGDAQGNACGVYYAEDKKAIYFISEPNGATGNGTLKCWDGKGETVVAANVFAFQYKANGRLAYLQNYDIATGLGDLCYYDGKQSRLLDTGVTALFMY